jgi:hypothetical protein
MDGNEQYVRSRWDGSVNHQTGGRKSAFMCWVERESEDEYVRHYLSGIETFSTEAEMWQAAAEFTRQREEEIRQVEEEIEVIGKACSVFPFYADRCERMVSRYEHILNDLRKGMKEQHS